MVDARRPRRLYLHIGAPKTGTSALQVFFARNDVRLERSGILYPRDDSHSMARQGRITSGNGFRLHTALSGPEEALSESAAWRGFVAALDSREHVLYSSEFFYLSLVLDTPNVRRLAMEAAERAREIRVVCYLRPQEEQIIAAYGQHVKRSGLVEDLDAFVAMIRERFDYASRVRVLEEVFGRRSIVLRAYGPDQFVNGSIEADMLHVLGLGDQWNEFEPLREVVNPSLSAYEIEVLRYLNRFGADTSFSDRLVYMKPGDGWSRGLEGRLSLNRHIDELEAFYREGNDYINREYLSRVGQHLEVVSRHRAEAGVVEQSSAVPGPHVRALSLLVLSLSKDVEDLRTRLARAEEALRRAGVTGDDR